MSTLRPTVFFHCRPARAIRRRRLSPSLSTAESGLRGFGVSTVELAALSMDWDAPEKYAWML
jgi:hypothetical protein